ncbi:MAG: nicotinate (nicotinamide) nucleotide adenylyltransferase [Chloroflexi bacterium]|nr:nicotinate (nicotinamide) nucleotide adenylyltransferase [Chloroflexota bacterium]
MARSRRSSPASATRSTGSPVSPASPQPSVPSPRPFSSQLPYTRDTVPTPPPSPPAPPSIGLLGGTFDPPHIGHLVLGECARVQFGLDKVIFLPAGDPWRKTGLRTEDSGLRTEMPSPAEHRLAMVRLAVAGNPHFEVDDREVRRPGPTYTVDTLEEYRVPSTEYRVGPALVLILGSDALADMPNWKDPDRIRALATLAVAPKPATADVDPGLGTQYPALTIDMPPLAISSTVIRARVAAGKPIRYLVPEAVEAYIREHMLYVGVKRQPPGV